MDSKKNQNRRDQPARVRASDDEWQAFVDAITPASQVEALGRIIRWFTAQPDEVRALVMGTLPERLRPEAVRLMMADFEREVSGGAATSADRTEAASAEALDAGRSARRRSPPAKGKSAG
jgi:hypothetical protein